ncbi:Heat shock cognate 71 kDa protein [Myotis brandtii]|uniref:Heat shock cognate 71 kDa protein n=1 Tax=Myotis brandtii TaxID=109478 RepID=S7NNN6_MYOBR|nr:Heat shock cognate 71 kDa protein [Myotis brandtii]
MVAAILCVGVMVNLHITSLLYRILNCLDRNQSVKKEEYEYQQKELEKVCNSMIPKLSQSAGGKPGEMPGAFQLIEFFHLVVPLLGPPKKRRIMPT